MDSQDAMKPTRQKPIRTSAEQKEYWALVGRWSFPAICLGAVLTIPFILRICLVMLGAVSALKGVSALPVVEWLGHWGWAVLGAVGVALATGGMSLARQSRREYQRLEREGTEESEGELGDEG